MIRMEVIELISEAGDLGKAIKNEENHIEIEGKLVEHIIKINKVGKIAWRVAIGGIGVAVSSLFLKVGSVGTLSLLSTPAILAGAAPAISILGPSTTASAIKIAFSAGGVKYLNELRSYKMLTRRKYIILVNR